MTSSIKLQQLETVNERKDEKIAYMALYSNHFLII